jgi:general L-amino acid transport system permease protein
MTAKIFQSLPARPAPTRQDGLLGWLRANLFGDLRTSLATVLIGGLLLWLLPQFLQWAVFSAVWRPDFEACRADGVGACWGVVAEKYRLSILGRYPFEEQWRPLVATLLMLSLLVASCVRFCWKPWLVLLWAAWLAIAAARVRGINFMLSVFCVVWMADVAAYFGGRAFGRRRGKADPCECGL